MRGILTVVFITCVIANPLSNIPTVTEPAQLQHKIVGRDVATCAYISGNPASPLTCPQSYTCGQRAANFNCCNAVACVDDWRLCANYGDTVCAGGLSPSACSSIYTSILSCSSEAPYCFKYARYSSLGAANTWSSWGCGPSPTPSVVLALVGTTPDGGATPSQTGRTQTTAIINTPTKTSAPGQNPTPTVDASSGSSGPPSFVIIIAIIVPVFVVTAIIACAIGCCCFKNWQKRVTPAVDPPQHGSAEIDISNASDVTPSLAGGVRIVPRWQETVVPGSPAPPSVRYPENYRLSELRGSPAPPYRDRRSPQEMNGSYGLSGIRQ